MQITIKNFRNIKHTSLDLDGGAVMFGNNAQGKSSVLYAVQYALYGWNAMTDRRGAGSEALIRDGAKEAEIEISLNDVIVHCTIKKKGSNEWYCSTPEGEILEDIKNRADLWRRWNLTLDRASIAGQPEAYLDSKELGDALAAFLAGEINQNNLLALCGPYQDWLRTFSAKHHIGLTCAQDLADIGVKAEAVRRDLNRELKTARANLETLGQPATDRDVAEIPKIEASLRGIETRLAALHEELGRAKASRPQAEIAADMVSVGAALELARKGATEARQKAEHLESAKDAAQNEVNAAQQADSTAKYEYDHAKAVRDKAALAVADNKEYRGGCCPTCAQIITEEAHAALLTSLQTTLNYASTALETADARLNGIHERVTNAQTMLSEARHAHSAATSEVRDAELNVSALVARLDALKRESSTLTRPVATIEADIKADQEKAQRGIVLLEQLRAKKQITEQAEFVEFWEPEVERLNWAVEHFRDGAMIKDLTGTRMQDFCDAVNVHLKPYALHLEIEQDGKRVEVTINRRPARQQNSGTRALACYALARAFAAGAPVLLDDINHLDAGNRKALLMALRDAGSEVLVAGTWQQSKPLDGAAAMQLSPLGVYWIEDGIAAKLATQTIKEAANA